MARLPKFTVSKRDDGKWALSKDGADRATKLFDKKADVSKGGALRDAVGKAGGSVKIQKVAGNFRRSGPILTLPTLLAHRVDAQRS